MFRHIFLGLNDFQVILYANFPKLKTRQLTRAQWSIIRRMIGRPRRFSTMFLNEERRSLQDRRRIIQDLQHLITASSLGVTAAEHMNFLLNCLPSSIEIPFRLPVGTKVCFK